MSLIDFILNVAGLLLWLNWRSVHFDPFARLRPATLTGTVRRAEPLKIKRWHFLAALFGLLPVRAGFYWLIGPAVDWVPRLDLGIVVLRFQGTAFGQVLLFSFASFISTLAVFYFWLLAITFINGRSLDPDPLQKLILLQLGKVVRWPRFVQVILPGLVAAGLWLAAHPLLAWADIIKPAQSTSHLLGQSAMIGGAIYFTLKTLLPVFLFLHLIVSYVYLGNSPVWDFISLTARNLLAPLNGLPLRTQKVDFAPLVGIVLILLLLVAVPLVVQLLLRQNNLTLWPQ
jgi:uncharacterized protein YggT (Ycf19 family)